MSNLSLSRSRWCRTADSDTARSAGICFVVARSRSVFGKQRAAERDEHIAFAARDGGRGPNRCHDSTPALCGIHGTAEPELGVADADEVTVLRRAIGAHALVVDERPDRSVEIGCAPAALAAALHDGVLPRDLAVVDARRAMARARWTRLAATCAPSPTTFPHRSGGRAAPENRDRRRSRVAASRCAAVLARNARRSAAARARVRRAPPRHVRAAREPRIMPAQHGSPTRSRRSYDCSTCGSGSLASFPWSACDAYVSGHRSMLGTRRELVPVANGSGDEFDVGELTNPAQRRSAHVHVDGAHRCGGVQRCR